MENILIRKAQIDDYKEILNIYEKYIRETCITFEIEVPSDEEFRDRTKTIIANYPYLVCEIEGKVVGYAYATKHAERAAYDYDVNLSIYINQAYHKRKIGSLLYSRLLKLLKAQGYYNAYAGITLPNEKSLSFHQALGFETVGTYQKTGYKFEQWHDVIWLQKNLIDYTIKPKAIIPIEEID